MGMIMLSSYYDRSEYPNTPHILSVAGYLSHVEIWKDFDREWKAFLHRPDFNLAYFHMKEFTVSQGEFANGWKGEHRKRREFLAGLIDIIKRNTTVSFATAVRVDEFNAAVASLPLHPACPIGSPFAYCGWLCVEGAKNFALKNGYGQPPIQSYFEDGEEDEGKLRELLAWSKHPVPQFKPKVPKSPEQETDCLSPLQAADFAAWEATKFTRTVDEIPDIEWEDLRESFKQLQGYPPAYWNLIEGDAIKTHLRQYVDAGYLRMSQP
jgi:hypothetical protein